MAKKIIPIPQEAELRQKLYEAMQGDAVLRVMKSLGIDKVSNVFVSEELQESGELLLDEKSSRKLTEPFSLLYQTFEDVKNTLGFTKPTELYLSFSREINASCYTAQIRGDVHIIVINSALVKIMTLDEIRFIMGHELGHSINDTGVLQRVKGFVFQDVENFTGLIKDKYLLWSRLSELVADRYGYLACADIATCCSAMEKMDTGMGLTDLGYDDFDIYVSDTYDQLIKYSQEGIIPQYTHPDRLVRLWSLYLVSNYKNLGEVEYNNEMEFLFSILIKLNETQLGMMLARFLALSGYAIASADGEISQDELDNIYVNISTFQMMPREYFDEVMGLSDKEGALNNLIKSLLKVEELNVSALMKYLVDLVIADNRVGVNEITVLLSICSKLRITKEEVAEYFVKAMSEDFDYSTLVM